MHGKLRAALGLAALVTWSAHAVAEEPAERTALVGFEAVGHAARLQSNWRASGEQLGWYTVCVAPCTRLLPATATLRAAGDGFDPSDPFVVPRGEDRVVVTSTLKHKSHAVPIVMTAVGFGAMLAIGPGLVIGGIQRGMTDEPGGSALTATGLGLMLGGAIVGTVGLVWLVASLDDKRSSVTITSRSSRLELPGGLALAPSGITF
jgi:hypothetical protein